MVATVDSGSLPHSKWPELVCEFIALIALAASLISHLGYVPAVKALWALVPVLVARCRTRRPQGETRPVSQQGTGKEIFDSEGRSLEHGRHCTCHIRPH
jgi:hypothetical protein